ncbi:hypothetical protein LJC16_00905 [Bacteroidales bacterium OttesenSCG-928-C19]|nr:hypothetical protein [Bacteroidales bacterium OttesenSCG-928-C19]
MIRSVYFLLILICPFVALAQQLSFEEEDITFEIKDSIFSVDGIYYFNSLSENKFSISYPFPKESIYGHPFNIKVIDLASNKNIDYRYNQDTSAVLFQIDVNGLTPVKISYQQKLKSNRAKYILTTTKHWNTPLKQAGYKLITDIDFNIINFSIRPDKEVILDGKRIHFWHKVNFFPDTDFKVEF